MSSRNPSPPVIAAFGERGLTASPSAPNIVNPQLYREALARISSQGRLRRARTALVIPDYAVRMAVLDFEEFPPNDPERTALIRFRLRKSVPFHIDEAQLSYSVQVSEPRRIEVLAVAIAGPILKEYESIFTDAGFRVGMVTPSSIATLPLCMKPGKSLTLLAKAAGATLSIFLLEQTRVRLVRCLDLAEGSANTPQGRGETVIPLLQQTIAYAEDQIGTAVGRVLLCGFGAETDTLGRGAQEEFGIPYSTVESRFGVASQENAGLLGLLEQYTA